MTEYELNENELNFYSISTWDNIENVDDNLSKVYKYIFLINCSFEMFIV